MKKNSKMTDEELESLKEQLKKELLEEMKNSNERKTTINNSKNKKEISNFENNVTQEKVEFKIPVKESKLDKFENVMKEKETKNDSVELNHNDKTSSWLIIIIILIVIIGMFFLPKVYKYFANNVPQEKIVDKKEKEEEKPEIKIYKWDDKEIKELTYPIMRNDEYSSESYYKVKSITMSDFSNNDILYNAFINVYNGNLATYTEGYSETYCGTGETHKTFNAKYIDARVNNLYTKSTEYVHSDFIVPTNNKKTSYVGKWKYDATLNRYIYYGACQISNITDTIYYDVLVPGDIITNDTGDTVYLNYYIGFAIIKNNTYELYSDAEYNNLVTSGSIEKDYSTELAKVVEKEKKNFKTYKYTFGTTDCAYQDFCFEKGEFK